MSEQNELKPGIYEKLRREEYFSIQAISPSMAKPAALKSLKHAKHEMDNPPSSDALILGDALHALVLEPDRFAEMYATAPKFNRRSNAGKAEEQAWMEANAGKTALEPDEWAKVKGMRDSILEHPEASELLRANAMVEPSLIWEDRQTGILCRTRPDRLLRDFSIDIDIKTTTNAKDDASGFIRDVLKFGYHIQAGARVDAVDTLTGRVPLFKFIAVEKTPPYACQVHPVSGALIEYGWKLWHKAIQQITECMRSGEWPGYEKAKEMALPAWCAESEDVALTIGGEAMEV